MVRGSPVTVNRSQQPPVSRWHCALQWILSALSAGQHRPLAALPVLIFIWKVIVRDKVLGWGLDRFPHW
jgi:hypothetical protein